MKRNKHRQICLIIPFLFICSTIPFGCSKVSMHPSEAQRISGLFTQAPGGADDFIIVDCKLPGQIRQLGRNIVYLARGASEKTTALDCATRGGEFAVPGQTDYHKALLIWMPDAEKGDAEAQYYVGEIYQRGEGATPQPSKAAEWFRKAASQGYVKAQMSLGYLYENGLGVEKDQQQASFWYRKATGMDNLISLNENALGFEERQELEELRQEVTRRREETETLQQKLQQIQKDLEKSRQELKLRSDHGTEATQDHEVAVLKDQIVADENTIAALRTQLAQNEEQLKKVPAPSIEIYTSPDSRGVLLETGKQGLKKRLIAGRVWAPAGLANFSIDHKPEEVGEDGKFRAWVPLKSSGDIDVLIVAVDQRGKSTSRSYKLNEIDSSEIDYSSQLMDQIKSIDFGHYHALVIGNDDYKKLPRLKTAINDAKEIAEVLSDKYGFKTTLLLDATRYQIIRALDNYRETLSEKENLLIYYAGHGYLEDKNNRGYWLPIDAERDSRANWISNVDITDQLNSMNAKEVIIISDSCYSGALTRGSMVDLKVAQSPEVRVQYIKELAKGHARMVLTSGELKPVLDAGGGDHSVFAGALLDVLKANNQVLEGNLLHQEMSDRVTYESKNFGLTQVPQYAANIQAGHKSGDFIFVPQY